MGLVATSPLEVAPSPPIDGGRGVGERARLVGVGEGGGQPCQPFCIGTHHQFGDGQGRIGDGGRAGGRGDLHAARAHLDGQDKGVNTCFCMISNTGGS